VLDLFAEMFSVISSTFQRFAIIAKISIQFSAFDSSNTILAQNILIPGKVTFLEVLEPISSIIYLVYL
jgi:hypothetical protein